MTYASGQTILASDFNAFANQFNATWGAGSTTQGWGQTGTTIATQSAGTTISASHWSTLITRMNSAWFHCINASGTGLASPSSGNTISPIANMQTQLNAIDANRFGHYPSYSSTPGSTLVLGAVGDAWVGTHTSEWYIDWASAAAMRYFFNAGGIIAINLSGANISSGYTTKSNDWVTTQNNMGTTYIYGNSVAGSNIINSGLYYWGSINTGYQVVSRRYSVDATYGYGSNRIDFSVRFNSTTAGNETRMWVKIEWFDVDPDTSIPVSADYVYGTSGGSVYTYIPELTNIGNSWGTVTITGWVNSRT